MVHFSIIARKVKGDLRLLRCNGNGNIFSAVISASIMFAVMLICKFGSEIYNRTTVRIPAIMPSRFLLNISMLCIAAILGFTFSCIIHGGWLLNSGASGVNYLNMFLAAVFFILWYPLFFGAKTFFFSILSLLSAAFFAYLTLRKIRCTNILLIGLIIATIIYEFILILSNVAYIFLN